MVHVGFGDFAEDNCYPPPPPLLARWRGLFCMSGLQMDHALFLRRDVLIARMRGICRGGGGQLRDLPRSEAKQHRTDLKCLFCPQFSSVQFGGSVPFHVLIGILATANFVLLKGQRPDGRQPRPLSEFPQRRSDACILNVSSLSRYFFLVNGVTLRNRFFPLHLFWSSI